MLPLREFVSLDTQQRERQEQITGLPKDMVNLVCAYLFVMPVRSGAKMLLSPALRVAGAFKLMQILERGQLIVEVPMPCQICGELPGESWHPNLRYRSLYSSYAGTCWECQKCFKCSSHCLLGAANSPPECEFFWNMRDSLEILNEYLSEWVFNVTGRQCVLRVELPILIGEPGFALDLLGFTFEESIMLPIWSLTQPECPMKWLTPAHIEMAQNIVSPWI